MVFRVLALLSLTVITVADTGGLGYSFLAFNDNTTQFRCGTARRIKFVRVLVPCGHYEDADSGSSDVRSGVV